jgi:hypothetical protein
LLKTSKHNQQEVLQQRLLCTLEVRAFLAPYELAAASAGEAGGSTMTHPVPCAGLSAGCTTVGRRQIGCVARPAFLLQPFAYNHHHH